MENELADYQTQSFVASLRVSTDQELTSIAIVGCDEIVEIGHLALAVASCLAKEGKRVIIICCGAVTSEKAASLDALLKPNVHSAAKVDLEEKRELALGAGGKVDIIGFGLADNSHGRVVANDAFIHTFSCYIEEYDCVVAAVPFAHKTIDASVVAHMADVTSLVSVQGATRRKDLKIAAEALSRSDARIAGICMVDPEG